MAGSNHINMLEGPIFGRLLLFALPLAMSSMLQQLFNSADMAVVGHFAGKEAMAAVGGNSAVINLLVNLFVGISIGANVVIAACVGRRKAEQASEAVHTSMTLALWSGFILLFAGVFLARPILVLMDT
ncbi:MAG: MATE family efflux transporter, partial [Mailhella sp.]|nr:MATE family efflux transporter [Mailhella sp.]